MIVEEIWQLELIVDLMKERASRASAKAQISQVNGFQSSSNDRSFPREFRLCHHQVQDFAVFVPGNNGLPLLG